MDHVPSGRLARAHRWLAKEGGDTRGAPKSRTIFVTNSVRRASGYATVTGVTCQKPRPQILQIERIPLTARFPLVRTLASAPSQAHHSRVLHALYNVK
jgi:hypothetical protein